MSPTNSHLHGLQADIRSAAGPIRLATVSLGRDSRASGFVIAPNTVLTNAHAVRDRTIQVSFADGHTAQGSVIGADPEGDLAVIQVDTADIGALSWSEVAPEPGIIVFTGHGRSGVSLGLVTATGNRFRGPRGRIVTNAFEHNAPLNRGGSGGPVVNVDGQVVGINTSRTDAGYQAIAASEDLHRRISAMTAGNQVDRPTLGIAIVDAAMARQVRQAAGLPERDGVLISAVASASPAELAGLSQGDLIVRIGETPVESIDDVHTGLSESPVSVVLHVVRGTAERTVEVRFDKPTM